MNTQLPAERVVVIDDDYAMRLSCEQILSRMGFAVDVYDNGADGLDGLARSKPALIVVDLKMPGISGMEVVARAHELDPDAVILVITGYATIDTAVEAMKSGAYDFLPKPFAPDELRVIVNRGLERRALQRETRQLREEQEQLRRRFITFVSHQLQSPLSAVHQYLDVLKRMGDGEAAAARRAEWLDRCLIRTEELQSLIRDWLTLSRVEGGAFVRAPEPMDLRALVVAAPARFADQAAARGVAVHAQIPSEECPVLADAKAVDVLIENLIGNAIKYNRPNGSVTVTLSTHGNEITLAVADTGIGIPAQQREFLFNEFFRAHSSSSEDIPGTGLGLAICKRIVAELGGTITVESEEGAGTTFTVALPLVRHSAAAPVAATA
ncbi:MAG TPA: ATP-binding protein [Longimicrobiales bacterium]|nr:ATP-binding protein [Longimicrobiales bacterium]